MSELELKPGLYVLVEGIYQSIYTNGSAAINIDGNLIAVGFTLIRPASILEELRAEVQKSKDTICNLETKSQQHEQNAARWHREWMKMDARGAMAERERDEAVAWIRENYAAGLARHETPVTYGFVQPSLIAAMTGEQPERRKEKRRKVFNSHLACRYSRRYPNSDRRQLPTPVDWQARCLASEKENERLRDFLGEGEYYRVSKTGNKQHIWLEWDERLREKNEQLAAATARAEAAEAECKQLSNTRDCWHQSYVICLNERNDAEAKLGK